MDYSIFPSNDVICIDMKSFYASCECVLHGLDPLTAKLAVVGDINRNGSVVLASSPVMKKMYDIKTGSRLYEILKINDPEIKIVQSRMGEYHKTAKLITEIFEEFVPPNSIHVYSVDESWLTLNGTKHLHGNVWEASDKIIKRVEEKTGIPAAVGIGDNKFLAKTALDNYGKNERIAEIRYKDVSSLLHPLPIGNMWGVGLKMKQHFNEMGIFTFGDLARYPIEHIKKRFGKMGEQLYWYSWGIDLSPVFYNENEAPPSVFGFSLNDKTVPMKSVGRGITLLKDYYKKTDIILIIRELIDEICLILRQNHMTGKTIHLSFSYSKNSFFSGFSRQKTIKTFTNDPLEILDICLGLMDNFHMQGEPVRQINVSVAKITSEGTIEITDKEILKRRRLADASDKLNNKYGKGTILRATSLKKESVAKDRTKKIRGHFE